MGAKWHVYPEMAAAGLWTTASDLARFAIEVQKSAIGESNKVLSRTTVHEMLAPVGVGDFAVGFQLQRLGQGWYVGYGGSDWGFQADLIAHMVHGYGFAVMTNSDRGGAVMQELRRRVERAYDWDSIALPAPRGYDAPITRDVIELPLEKLQEYPGSYALNEVTLTLSMQNGGLYAQGPGQAPAQMFASAVDEFFLRVAPIEVLFERNDAGEVTGLIVVQGGQRQSAPRLPE